MKRIVILGSTGSIGKQALEVVDKAPDAFCVVGLSCLNNIEILNQQIAKYKPKFVCIANNSYKMQVIAPKDCTILLGEDGLDELASIECDLVINALVGLAGLRPTISCLNAGRQLALANKETLVAGGDCVNKLAKSKGIDILPIDSEHSAIWQCLDCDKTKKVNKLILTASGGAFRDFSIDEIVNLKARDALKHPVWDMGSKVTIDSATMMNKGLEIIEAMYLFDKNVEDIEIVMHKQSIVHSMISYEDGSIIAQMSYPDMRLPISLAMHYPNRANFCHSPLDFSQLQLNFEKPNLKKYPCLAIALECAKKNGNYKILMNSANEILVENYLKDLIKFYDIPYYINVVLDKLGNNCIARDYKEVLELDLCARNFTNKLLRSSK